MDLKQNYTLESVRETIQWLDEMNIGNTNTMDRIRTAKRQLIAACIALEPETRGFGTCTTVYNDLQRQLGALDRELSRCLENHDRLGDRLRDLYGIEADLETDKAERENALRHPLTDREADFAV